VSKAWTSATTGAAIETADYVLAHLNQLANTRDNDKQRDGRIRKFCESFVERAFRRPLTDAERKLYIARQFEGAPNAETAVRRSVMLTLTSPRFLYRDLGERSPDDYDVAERLSFALWDSIPDQTLLDAARKGELKTRDQIAWHARRMVSDPRAKAKMHQFLQYWLDIEHVPDLSKDDDHFKGFDNTIASDLRTSLELFLDEVMWSERSDFRQLLNSDEMYVNGRLAAYYGFDLPKDAPFRKVKTTNPRRTGVLTHPYVLARFAYRDATSPIHRGVFLVRSVLGRALRPPPEAVAPTPVDLHPNLTTRERVEKQTEPRACQTCHSMINSLGFTLEHYDAVGRFRSKERGRPIDARGAYELPSGKMARFHNAEDLAKFLTRSPQSHGAFVVQLFHHLAKQPIRAYGPDESRKLREAFSKNAFSMRKLMVDAAVVVAGKGPERPAAQSE